MQRSGILPRSRVLNTVVKCMQCGQSKAEEILAASDRERRTSLRNWHDAAHLPIECAVERSKRIKIPNLPKLKSIVSADTRGLVISGIHMGDYLHALLPILLALRGRKVLVCRQRSQTTEESAIVKRLATLGIDAKVIRTGRHHPLMLVRELRRGGIVITFHDLSARWGPVHDAYIFGLKGRLVRGPATLAVLGKARLLPFATVQTSTGKHCVLENIIDCAHTEDGPASIKHITRYLAKHLELTVLSAPHQWLHWPVLAEIVESVSAPSAPN